MTKFETTTKIKNLRSIVSDEEVCRLCGISKPTLYVRLKKNNWKITEISHIKNLIL